jgi:hypothetical protein
MILRFSWFKTICIMSALSLTTAAMNTDRSRVPVLLELFTSEGCSSCPPADRLLEALDQQQPVPGAELIVLSEHVDYWNHLGWRDPFSSAQYSARQRDYAGRYNADGVYTPELVVDGRYSFVGSDRLAASSAIQSSIGEPKMPIVIAEVSRNAKQVIARIELPAAGQFKSIRGVLCVVLADERQESRVGHGENAGHSLAHVAVARTFRQIEAIGLDRASTKQIALEVQPGSETAGLRLIAFVQDRKTGHVIGAAARRL